MMILTTPNDQAKQYLYVTTEVGYIEIVAVNNAITHLHFVNEIKTKESVRPCAQLTKAYQQVTEYIEGKRKTFNLNLAPQGTDFQKKVWQQLATIPYGKTTYYQQIANQLAMPTGSRAIGMANGKNPISIIVPCHRVIGKSGNLTGYAGGLERKKWLLALEANNALINN